MIGAFSLLCAALVLIATAWSLYDYRRKALLWDRLCACCHGNELAVLEAAEAMQRVEQELTDALLRRGFHKLSIEDAANLARSLH